jgi:hypothetical protein
MVLRRRYELLSGYTDGLSLPLPLSQSEKSGYTYPIFYGPHLFRGFTITLTQHIQYDFFLDSRQYIQEKDIRAPSGIRTPQSQQVSGRKPTT